MANCPKCGVKLKITDWRPNCPKCGVNLVYYGMEERLLADADKAESEHAVTQKKFDRIKASFVGSKLTIIRIVLSVLPIAALMLPLARIEYVAPYIEKATDINAIAVYNTVSSLDFDLLFNMLKSEILGSAFTYYFAALVCILLCVVGLVLNLVFLMLSCSPKGKARNITLNSLLIALSLGSMFSYIQFSSKITNVFPTIFNSDLAGAGGIKFGAYIFIATLFALLAINIIIAKVGVKVKYKQTYINGIPSEEYFEAKEKGEDIEALRLKYVELKKVEDAAAAEAAEVAEKEKETVEAK